MIPLRSVHQIELTSRCNLACRYCVHPKMPRPKQDMSFATFERAIWWAARFKERGTQGELNLAGIGESTMHPQFVEMVAYARRELGDDQILCLATNGIRVTEELAAQLAPYKPRMWVSLHRPERAGKAVQHLKKHGLLVGVSADPSISPVDWAGQVDWFVDTAAKGAPCQWVRGGWAFVMSDGSLSRCCFDGTGEGKFGTIFDDLDERQTSPWKLCQTCHLDVGIPLESQAA